MKVSRCRLSVYRSNTAIYAQVIDDTSGFTLASPSSLNLVSKSEKKTNCTLSVAREVGVDLGNKAIKVGVSEVFFDKSRFKYHGLLKELAEGARGGGLVF